MNHIKSSRSEHSVLKQICNFIPGYLSSKMEREHGEGKCKERTFSVWSHVVSMVYAHLSSAVGLNGVCDGLRVMGTHLFGIREATVPSRNNLSNCNKKRPAEVIKEIFWHTLEHLQKCSPGFARGGKGKGLLRRFTAKIHILDSTTIQLIISCIDWAKHRRRKAAAKCHVNLDYHTLMPNFVLIDTAKENDAKRARELCAHIRGGEIVIFDKAYLDFAHLLDLDEREVFWVSRAKENMVSRCKKKLPCKGNILSDKLVVFGNKEQRKKYPKVFRLVTALVEINGEQQEMTFITNNTQWAASSVADLYKSRWQIEAFFKQIKQTFRLHGFLGQSANAVRWQIWSALLAYVLLKYLTFIHSWQHSFARLASLARVALWVRISTFRLFELYGTAKGSLWRIHVPEQPWLPGFEPVEIQPNVSYS